MKKLSPRVFSVLTSIATLLMTGLANKSQW